MKFSIKYFLISIALFLIEVAIAKYATGFIRHSIGDYLCVILLYTLIKSFTNLSVNKTGLIVLFIAYVVEFLQLTSLKNMYPTEYAKTINLILGTSFSFGDLLAYFLGILTVFLVEKMSISTLLVKN